ncbi:hypothetical protein EG858_15895, partial [Enterococcus faecalis]
DDYRESAGDARHGVAGEAPQPQEGVQQRGREPRGRRVRGLAHEGGGRVSGHGREDGWADGRAGRGALARAAVVATAGAGDRALPQLGAVQEALHLRGVVGAHEAERE